MSECKSGSLVTLYGMRTDRDKIIGYCGFHKRHLTIQQLKNRECLRKGCTALKKWEHPFWEDREKRNELKRKKRAAGIPAYKKVKTTKKGKVVEMQ